MNAKLETATQGLHIVAIDECAMISIRPVAGWERNPFGGWYPMWFNAEKGCAVTAIDICEETGSLMANYSIVRSIKQGEVVGYSEESEAAFAKGAKGMQAVRATTERFIKDKFGEVGWERTRDVIKQFEEENAKEVIPFEVDL